MRLRAGHALAVGDSFTAGDYVPERIDPGDGVNLLTKSLAAPAAGRAAVSQSAETGHRAYRNTATDGSGEHCLALRPIPAAAGVLVESLDALLHDKESLRVQLLDAGGNGWSRLWLSERLPADNPQLLLQLANRACSTAFAPSGEGASFRRPQLERGAMPTPHRATSTAR